MYYDYNWIILPYCLKLIMGAPHKKKGEMIMKNICKNLIVMFLMVLSITVGYSINAFASDDFEIGTSNLNNTAENSAKVGDKLEHPEIGWKRYDDKDSEINWENGRQEALVGTDFKNSHGYLYLNNVLKFRFNGSKLRIISFRCQDRSPDTVITIDGVSYNYSEQGLSTTQVLLFEKLNMEEGVHEVIIENGKSNINICLDAIDIDETGCLVGDNKSIFLDKSIINLTVGYWKDLTANTTPEMAQVNWSSSDNSIATVDQNGKVTGVKEGTCIITALIEGTNIKDTCEVTVTKEDAKDPIGDGNLYIEMMDGNIKHATKSEIDGFLKWYKNRDADKTENPVYKITNEKGNEEYLVHDKIVAFEVR